MLNLIVGGSGCGKTHLIEEKIKEDIEKGKRVFLIVPEQQTVDVERRMLDLLPSSAQLNFEALNFTRLANRVFREYGGLSYKYVSRGVKALAMWNTLRGLSPLLNEYGGRCDRALSSIMLSAVSELRAYCVTPAKLEAARDRLEKGSPLYAKLTDLSLIYAAYESSTAEYGDGAEDLNRLQKVLSEHNFFSGSNVYIDSFTDFTLQEYEIIKEIFVGADDTFISVCMDSEARFGVHFDKLSETVKRLNKIAEAQKTEVNEICLTENYRTDSDTLKLLGKHIWSFGKTDIEKPEGNRGDVILYRCNNEYEEADAATMTILKLVSEGMRYRDITVLARNADDFRGIIDVAFEKAGIPYFMSKSTDITTKPLIKLILSALKIKISNWRYEDVISYVKTGLIDIPVHSIDLFEEYIWRWSISGNAYIGDDWNMKPYAYVGDIDEADEKVLGEVNSCRRAVALPLVRFFHSLDSADSNRELCRALFEFLEELNIREQLLERAKKEHSEGKKKSASENVQLYNSVLSALDAVAEIENEERFTLSEFDEALRIIFDNISIGTIPTSCDEVSVGSASLFRANSPRCVILLGLNDGVFPETAKESEVFSDEDKKRLSELGITLSSDSTTKNSEELFYVYRAISAPSEVLVGTYSTSKIEGVKEERKPSIAYNRIKYLTGVTPIAFSDIPIEDRIYNKTQAREYMRHLVRTASPAGEAVERILSEDEDFDRFYKMLSIPTSQPLCQINKELTDEIFGKHMSFSPTALEKYVKCHFNYCCEHILHLRHDEKNKFSLLDTGTLIHAILEKIILLITDEHGFNSTLADKKLDELIEKYLAELIEELLPERALDEPRVMHTLHKLKFLARFIVKNVAREISESKFVPTFFELKINDTDKGAIPPIKFTLEDGETTGTLKGVVDRVDLLRDGEDIYCKVVDYKTGDKNISLSDIKEGLNLQMLLYLFSLCQNENTRARELLGCSPNGEIKPAGVVYISSKTSAFDAKIGENEDEIIARADDRVKRTGFLLNDEKLLTAYNKNKDFKYIMSGCGERAKNSPLVSAEEFSEIYGELERTLVSILSELRRGNVSACPKDVDGKAACMYCSMRAICRVEHIEKNSEEEVIENG